MHLFHWAGLWSADRGHSRQHLWFQKVPAMSFMSIPVENTYLYYLWWNRCTAQIWGQTQEQHRQSSLFQNKIPFADGWSHEDGDRHTVKKKKKSANQLIQKQGSKRELLKCPQWDINLSRRRNQTVACWVEHDAFVPSGLFIFYTDSFHYFFPYFLLCKEIDTGTSQQQNMDILCQIMYHWYQSRMAVDFFDSSFTITVIPHIVP